MSKHIKQHKTQKKNYQELENQNHLRHLFCWNEKHLKLHIRPFSILTLTQKVLLEKKFTHWADFQRCRVI